MVAAISSANDTYTINDLYAEDEAMERFLKKEIC